jgi:hypothetical protein
LGNVKIELKGVGEQKEKSMEKRYVRAAERYERRNTGWTGI